MTVTLLFIRYISTSYNPSLTGPQRVHELIISELTCFSVTFNGRHLAWILVYGSHTKHTYLGC